MKKILIMLTVLNFTGGFSASVYARNSQDTNAKKQVKKEKIKKEYDETKKLIESKNFVLEADYLANRYGQIIPVTSLLNFISIEDDKAVIQIGSHNGMGRNGVGGITTEGNISDWQLNVNDKKNSLMLTMTVMTTLGIYDINYSINANGYADATLSGNFGGRLTYSGDVVSIQNSNVYKGTNSY